MFSRFPFHKVNWPTSSFLIGTLALTLTAVPAYVWRFGLDWFQVTLFMVMFCACGLSITLGYHRLFAHRSFHAHWSVRLFVLLFGAGAFENSALLWACEHRTHHKHVDQEEDPYDVSKGLFHAHIGWLLFKLGPHPPFNNVTDLKRDPMVMWQYRYIHWIAAAVAFGLPSAIGYAWGGWQSALGAFLIAGVARVVVLQHCTFCINSLCHAIGRQPYSSRCSARDSWLMALVTFGEGYHNFHHEFQHDYRNGVRPWQFDPTKWTIWLLTRVGLASDLRRVSQEKILLAELREAQRQIQLRLSAPEVPPTARARIDEAVVRLQKRMEIWEQRCMAQLEANQEAFNELREEIRMAWSSLQADASNLTKRRIEA